MPCDVGRVGFAGSARRSISRRSRGSSPGRCGTRARGRPSARRARARLSFSRSCSSRSTTAVRSVNRQMAPCSVALARRAAATRSRRDASRRSSRLRHLDRRGGRSAAPCARHSLDDRRQRRGACASSCAAVAARRVRRGRCSIRRPAGFRIRTSPSRPTTSRPAVRLATISSLSRSDASARAAIARSCARSLRDRLLERGRHEQPARVAASRSCPRMSRTARDEPQHGERRARPRGPPRAPSGRRAA